MNLQKTGQAIAYLRKRAGFTQKDLGERIGISDKAVSKWERGLSLPDISCLEQLAIVLDTDTDSLLAGEVNNCERNWKGILYIRDVGVPLNTVVYDKPLVYYLISYFMLVGIREITVICSEQQQEEIAVLLGDGSELGVTITYDNRNETGIFSAYRDVVDHSNVMLVFGQVLLYGVEQTKFFERAMSNSERITVISHPRRSEQENHRIHFNSLRQVIKGSDDESKVRTQYDYCRVPILFIPKKTLAHSYLNVETVDELLERLIDCGELYTTVMDRGFIEIELSSFDDIIDAANLVKIIQERCGLRIYCIEEIAWRRGMINKEQLVALGMKNKNTMYGKYILDLCERNGVNIM